MHVEHLLILPAVVRVTPLNLGMVVECDLETFDQTQFLDIFPQHSDPIASDVLSDCFFPATRGLFPTIRDDTETEHRMQRTTPAEELDTVEKKRYPCALPGCGQLSYSKRDAERHYDAKHQSGHEKAQFFCPEKDCSRSNSARAKRPFPRNDQLLRHIRTVHAKLANRKVLPASCIPGLDDPDVKSPQAEGSGSEEPQHRCSWKDHVAELRREIWRLQAELAEERKSGKRFRSKVMLAIAADEAGVDILED